MKRRAPIAYSLIPEPMSTYSGEPVAPRRLSEKRMPAGARDELGLAPDDAEYAEKAWARPVEPSDLASEDFACEWPGEKCGQGCGCWIITNVLDPRRVQPIWWIP